MTAIKNPAAINASTTNVAPVGTVSAAGSIGFARGDHVHVGIAPLGVGGNLIIGGGDNVTLSAATAASAMTVTINANGGLGSTLRSFFCVQLPRSDNFVEAAQTVGSTRMHMAPFVLPGNMTVSEFNPLVFQAAPNVAGTSTSVRSYGFSLSIGLYSVDQANSSFVLMASSSYSNSTTWSGSSAGAGTSNTRFLGAARGLTLGMGTTLSLVSGVPYAIGVCDNYTGSTSTTSCGIMMMPQQDLTWNPQAFGTSNAATFINPISTISSYLSSWIMSAPRGQATVSVPLQVSIPFTGMIGVPQTPLVGIR